MAEEKYKSVSVFALPDAYQQQAAEARRRRRMAEMLAQQAYQPSDISAPIPAAAPLVQGLQAFLAARAARKADEAEETALETKTRAEREAAQQVAATGSQIAGRLMGGAPIRDIAPPDDSGLGEVAIESRYRKDPEGALAIGMTQRGGDAMKGNPMLAAMLARTMEPPQLSAAPKTAAQDTMQWNSKTQRWEDIPGAVSRIRDIANAKRPDVVVTGGRERERLVSVIGPDNKPKLVRESEAEGMMPFTARTAADIAADETREQTKRNSAFETGQSLQFLADLIKHPGRKAATGASYALGKIPGTEARGFVAKLDTFKSQMFLPAVKALQGLGALSNAEGMKLTDAIGAMNVEMEEKELESEMRRIGNYLFDKARVAGLDVALPPEFGKRAAISPPPGFELE